MSRLEELQRQRALVAEHLAWLDAELARLRGETGSGPQNPGSHALSPAPVTTTPPLAAITPDEAPPELKAEIEQELNKYQQESANSPAAAKRGCFVVFAVALGLLTFGVLGVYFLKYYH